MTWIECGPQHLEEIREIFNEAIVHSTALYDYEPRSPATLAAWWQAKQQTGTPVLGVVDTEGRLLGFASYGPFRSFPAYKYTVEHSVYVHHQHRGRGLGKALLTRLIHTAEARGFHTMIGVIDAANHASLELHTQLGFERCGEMRQVGFKFGRWLDLVLCQKLLSGPSAPVDG